MDQVYQKQRGLEFRWSCTCGATGEADNGKVLRGWGLWRNITDVERFLPQLIGDKESANWHQKTECPVKLCITKRQIFKYTVDVLTMGFLWCSLPRAFDKGKHVHLVVSLKKKKSKCIFIYHYI